MTEYQKNLVINTYFDVLMKNKIDEKDVEDFGQEEGVLYIVLKDGKKIRKQLKNFN